MSNWGNMCKKKVGVVGFFIIARLKDDHVKR